MYVGVCLLLWYLLQSCSVSLLGIAHLFSPLGGSQPLLCATYGVEIPLRLRSLLYDLSMTLVFRGVSGSAEGLGTGDLAIFRLGSALGGLL